MAIFRKILTAVRGHATEAGEAIVDANAITILDQEIRDAKEALRKSKVNLTEIMAQSHLHEKRVKEYQESIDRYMVSAEQALEKGEEALALEIAEHIASEQSKMATEQSLVDQFAGSIEALRTSIRQAENDISHLEQQVSVVKATENVQKAQASVAARHSGQDTGVRTALDSLDRIKAKQEKRGAQISAANSIAAEGSAGTLDAKMKAAGVGVKTQGASDILAQLKAKKEG